MTEYIFKPSRVVAGKRVRARLYSGRYSLERGQKPVRVALHTPDVEVARKKLRTIIVQQQRQAVGIESPQTQLDALMVPLAEVLVEYRSHLFSLDRSAGHIRDTLKRLERMVAEAGLSSAD